MKRRDFLKTAAAGVGALAIRDSAWSRLFAMPAANGAPLYGETPDANGLHLPPGFTSRRIATAVMPVTGADGLPVGKPGFLFPIFPDGAWAFADTGLDEYGAPTNPGGWILVVNSENPPPPDARVFPAGVQELFGGASAIRFAANGDMIDAYPVLGGTQTNCAGGPTPWGTWLSCEEYDNSIRFGDTSDAGRVWECDPTGATPGIPRDALGRFKHEAAAFDDEGRVYLTEDVGDGLLYRFTPDSNPNTPASLASGALEAWKGNPAGGSGTWVTITDPSAASGSTRVQGKTAGAVTFSGGEGVAFAPYDSGGGRIYFTTKGDDHVRAIDTNTGELEVIYDGSQPGAVLTGVDNIIVSTSGFTYVAEDGGDMEIVRIEGIGTANPIARPFLKLTGPLQGLVGVDYPGPVPLESEITGPAISPDGMRLYFGSQREGVFGAVYEVTAGPDATITL